MQKTQLKGILMLLLTAFIWGSSFVSQSEGMESVEAFTFNGIRTLLGGAVLVPLILIRNKKESKNGAVSHEQKKAATKKLLICGSLLGVVLCGASNFQQFAFNYSSPGKIAFITAFYMLFVPIFSLFAHKKIAPITWLSIVLGCIGLYFLCIGPEGFSGINKGDVLTLICAVIYAVHILLIERFAPEVDNIKLSCVQFIVSGTITIVLMAIFETPTIPNITAAAFPLFYSGVFSCGIAYPLQIAGQKYAEASVASILLCTESVFGVLSSAIILKEMLLPRETIGCIIMFIAIILSQSDGLIQRLTNKNKAIIK